MLLYQVWRPVHFAIPPTGHWVEVQNIKAVQIFPSYIPAAEDLWQLKSKLQSLTCYRGDRLSPLSSSADRRHILKAGHITQWMPLMWCHIQWHIRSWENGEGLGGIEINVWWVFFRRWRDQTGHDLCHTNTRRRCFCCRLVDGFCPCNCKITITRHLIGKPALCFVPK